VNEGAGHSVGIGSRYFPGKPSFVTIEVGWTFAGTVPELRRRGIRACGVDLNTHAIRQGRNLANEFIFAELAQSDLLERGQRLNIIAAHHPSDHIPKSARFPQ
jgi:hypothetical protein